LAAGEGDRHLRHVLHAARDHQILGARQDALGGEVQGLLRGAALPVDGHTGHLLGEPGGQPARPRDVTRLRSDRVQAAEDDVFDGGGVDTRALDEGGENVRSQVGRMDGGEPAVPLADGGPYRFDDVRLGHDCSSAGPYVFMSTSC
jgi:hypothetical protein